MRLPVLAAALLIFAPTPSPARTWPDVGPWTVVQTDGMCIMTADYEESGNSTVGIALDVDGHVMVGDANPNWSAEQDEVYHDVSFVIDRDRHAGDAVGIVVQAQRGFAIQGGGELLDAIARAKTLRIYKDGDQIDQIALVGAADGLEELRRCIASERTEQAALRRSPADTRSGNGEATRFAKGLPAHQ